MVTQIVVYYSKNEVKEKKKVRSRVLKAKNKLLENICI